MSEQNGSSSPARKTSRRGWIIAGSIVGVLALLVGAKTLVYAHDGGWRHGDFADHIEDHVKYMLSDVAATPEQEAQVTSILQSTASDVHTLRDQHLSAHKQLHEILSAETPRERGVPGVGANPRGSSDCA